MSAINQGVGTTPIVDEAIGGKSPSVDPPHREMGGNPKAASKTHPVERQTRAKRSRAQKIASAPRIAYGEGNSDVQARPISAAEEAAALDTEIRQLRRQLARKLSLQNAQLKKMLERF
ncbi:hypothetical protein IB270_29340 [Ensifer sp. ENS05]|uniref:hypothetical protein n=1 Tax=Ensifer sp. ENS05 TaxID=2769277 RepID=UPI00177FA4A9|nr:hypothetical protein [Ensifer sp. ENS05]MBD9596940.1 hypothetical protein [Ensifer sp. ENS05]